MVEKKWKTYGFQPYPQDVVCKHYPGDTITYSVGETKAQDEGGRLPLTDEMGKYVLFEIPDGRTLQEVLE